MENDSHLLIELTKGDSVAFSLLFRKYYRDLVMFGGHYLPDKERCEDIVQNIFLKLWAERENLCIETSLKSFLLRSVQNACLDELRHINVMRIHETYTQTFGHTDDLDTEHYVLFSDLQESLTKALEKLPEVYREAFEMHRLEGLKYKEIAARLNVSERTVEVRMGKAISLLRQYLKDFFPLIFFIFFS